MMLCQGAGSRNKSPKDSPTAFTWTCFMANRMHWVSVDRFYPFRLKESHNGLIGQNAYPCYQLKCWINVFGDLLLLTNIGQFWCLIWRQTNVASFVQSIHWYKFINHLMLFQSCPLSTTTQKSPNSAAIPKIISDVLDKMFSRPSSWQCFVIFLNLWMSKYGRTFFQAEVCQPSLATSQAGRVSNNVLVSSYGWHTNSRVFNFQLSWMWK